MIITIIPIGNSRGIRIPKPVLAESGLGGEVELQVKKGEIRIIPVLVKAKSVADTLLLSEKTLATDWDRPEEDAAWGKLAVNKGLQRAGSIVLVTFPFSNLKGQKVRPALVLANVEFGNLILCQVTSKPYTSKIAIRINSEDFSKGNLPVTSYARPDKLFTADAALIKGIVGELSPAMKSKILKSVRKLFSV